MTQKTVKEAEKQYTLQSTLELAKRIKNLPKEHHRRFFRELAKLERTKNQT